MITVYLLYHNHVVSLLNNHGKPVAYFVINVLCGGHCPVEMDTEFKHVGGDPN